MCSEAMFLFLLQRLMDGDKVVLPHARQTEGQVDFIILHSKVGAIAFLGGFFSGCLFMPQWRFPSFVELFVLVLAQE